MTRTAGRLVVTMALLGVAVLLWSSIPTKVESWAPIVRHGTVGEHVSGRNLEVTVHDVALARRLEFTSGGASQRVPTDGVWLVVDLSYGTIDLGATPTFAVEASDRLITSSFNGFGKPVQPGFSKRAPVAFELADTPSTATVFVSNDVDDQYGNSLLAPLDSQIAVTVTLDDSQVREFVDLDTVGR